jgi:hypothetical protein
LNRTRTLTLTLALVLACSLAARAQSEPVTEITRGGMQKMQFWQAQPTVDPEAEFYVRAAVTTDMPLIGDTLQLNLRAPSITKGKARLFADGAEVKIKKVLWTGPTSFESVPALRTSCWSLGISVNCFTRVTTSTIRHMGAVNEVSLLLKPGQLGLLAAARAITVEVNGKSYELASRHLALLRDLQAAFDQDRSGTQ